MAAVKEIQRQEPREPAYARFAQEWRDLGADIVGGFGGIGPDHIAELRRSLA